MSTELNNILFNPQSVGLISRACSSKLGFQLLKDKYKGKDCACETVDLKYLLRASKQIICYQAPGSTSNAGVLNRSTILLENDSYGWVAVSILSSNGDLNGGSGGVYPNIQDAIGDLIAGYIDTTSYVASFYLNPAGKIIFTIIAPDTVMCGVTYTINVTPKDVLHAHFIAGGTFSGGQCLVSEDDECITVNEANQIIENINEICGGFCSGCSGFYIDSERIT